MAGNASKPGVSVASRTLALLGAFDAAHRRLSLTDMARRADLPVPTAYRLVNELQRWGALTGRPRRMRRLRSRRRRRCRAR